jgi:hypothetical protein
MYDRPGFDLKCSTENNASVVVRDGVILGSMRSSPKFLLTKFTSFC